MNTPLRIEITDNAQSQISRAAAWWAEHRPAAPGAIHEERDRVLDLLRVQPDIGTLARRATLSGVRRVTLFRIRYCVYYRVVGDALQVLAFWHTSPWQWASHVMPPNTAMEADGADLSLSRRGSFGTLGRHALRRHGQRRQNVGIDWGHYGSCGLYVGTMKKKPGHPADDDMRPEYDLRGGVRGKYSERYMEGTNVVLLEPELAKVFRDSESVNEALRRYLSEHGEPPAVKRRAG